MQVTYAHQTQQDPFEPEINGFQSQYVHVTILLICYAPFQFVYVLLPLR
jgi:hypothetical protein